MPAPKQNDPERASKKFISECFGLDRQTVDRQLLAFKCQPSDTVAGAPVYRIRDVAPAMVAHYAPGVLMGDEHDIVQDPARMTTKQRDEWYASEKKRIEVEVMLEQRLPVTQVRHFLAMIFKIVAMLLDKLPGDLERRFQMTPEQADYLEKQIDGVRASMAAQLRRMARQLPDPEAEHPNQADIDAEAVELEGEDKTE